MAVLFEDEEEDGTSDYETLEGGATVFVTGIVSTGCGVTVEVATATGDPKAIATVGKNDPPVNVYSPGAGEYRIRAKLHGAVAGVDSVTVETN